MVTGHLGHIFSLEMTQAYQRSTQMMFAWSNTWLTGIGCLSNHLSNHYFHGPVVFNDLYAGNKVLITHFLPRITLEDSRQILNGGLTFIGCHSNHLSKHRFHFPGAFKFYSMFSAQIYLEDSREIHLYGPLIDQHYFIAIVSKSKK